jgi:hypothetical protein
MSISMNKPSAAIDRFIKTACHRLGEFMRKFILPVSLVGFICGCATTSPVTPLGADKYIVSAYHTQDASTAADKYCNGQGKKILVTNISRETNTSWASVIFRCLSPDDPEYLRDYQKTPPETIIKQRRR